MEEKVIGICTEFKNCIDGIGTVQTIWGLIVASVLIIVFIFCVFSFTKRINKVTKAQVERFKREGKYLPSIYIELNNSLESFRYFIFSYKWKHRVIRQYNHLFHGYDGKRLKHLLESDIKCNLSYFTPFSKLISVLSVMYNRLDGLRKKRRELYDEYGESSWAILNSTYNHIDAIRRLQKLCDMMSKKNIILVSNAGNGKTSLMCRLSEVAVANQIPCLLVNSRDIEEDCTEYIIKKLPIRPQFRKMTTLYLSLVSLVLFFQRKYFYIFIDAINENDREVFMGSLANLLKTFSKYSRIRILLTCRREYFDSRYKVLFPTGEEEPYISDLEETLYDERATKKMIMAYMEYYNVHGPFSLDMQEKLWNSLFLTRIFFEVNSNHNECMLEFRNAEIYKLYFDKIASENNEIDLSLIVNMIAKCMFDKFEFDRIPMDNLQLSHQEMDSLRRLMDNNLIISHYIRTGTGITEREEEYVYFVFDELRDFCLARYLLTLDESNFSAEYTLFFSNVTKLFAQTLSPVEGMLKYAYHHFRMTARTDLCEKILNMFGESDVQSILDWGKRGLHRRRTFNNFGFSLIFSEGDNIIPLEIEYILRCIKNDCRYYWEIFGFLLGNEYSGFKPNIGLAVDIMLRCKDDGTVKKILEFFFADRLNNYYPYSNEKCRVNSLKEWLGAIEKENGDLSENLKIIVTILAAYEPTEFALGAYHHFVIDERIFKAIQERGFCILIKSRVCEFRDSLTYCPTEQEALQTIMDILKNEGLL